MAKPKKNQILQFITPFVDKTDFATVESGVTSGFTQRLWGVKHGVSTATVAKTPSKTLSVVRSGVFRVTLKSTEVSDFDEILWQGTHASCADQMWNFELVDNDDSDMMSTLTIIQSMASDAHSAAVQANSRVLLVQSRLSDLDSRLVSDLSDVLSAVNVGNSRVLLNQSRISDAYSMLSDLYSDFQSRVPKRVATDSQLSDVQSDLRSLMGALTVTVSTSSISDIASAVDATLASRLSDILSAAQQANSRVLVVQSLTSDVHSSLSDVHSDLLSLLTTTGVQLNASTMSDLRSAINAITVTMSASDISDIASAVDATLASRLSDILSAAQQGNSRVLVVQSHASNVYSMLSDFYSDFQSRVPKLVATNSQLSDIHSDIISNLANISVTLTASDISDIASAVIANLPGLNASDISDIASAVDLILASRLSDILSAAQQGNSRVLVVQSMASDVYSLLSDTNSDLRSLLTETGVQLNASTMSDLRSAITAGGGITASDISDIASAVYTTLASNLSDILSAAQQSNSRVLVTQSLISDVYSLLSDTNSDLRSLLTATGVQLNASTMSDLRSAIAVGDGGLTASNISDIASAVRAILVSDLSDILSAAQQANSRALVIQSQTSDIYSLLSDVASDIGVMSGVLSDAYSGIQQVNSRVLLDQSVISDIYSLLSGLESDIQSRFPATIPELTGDPGATPTWAQAEAMQFMWLKNNTKSTSTKRFLRNNAGATVLSATLGDDGTSFVQGKLG